ncbi:MAG: DUF4377 domain-containing protein [Idiomarina sp.]|nr:DUF4377 domain-containing protein [Idiomarina sp.]
MLKLKTLPLLQFTGLLLAALLTGCDSSDDEGDTYVQETVVIDAQPAIAAGAFSTYLGYQMGFESGDQVVASWIEDFTFRWGYEVTARIKVVTYAEPPEDGPSTEYRLLEILDTTEDEVGTTYLFDYVLLEGQPASGIFEVDEDNEGYYLFFGETFVCAEHLNCDQLADMSNDGGTISAQFEYLGQSDDRPTAIMLTEWN